MIAEESISLFGGRRLDVDQARGVILALSGADVIREWETLATARSRAMSPRRYYAGIKPCDPPALDGRALLIGRGTTPASAIEDLLWQLVTPRLLSE